MTKEREGGELASGKVRLGDADHRSPLRSQRKGCCRLGWRSKPRPTRKATRGFELGERTDERNRRNTLGAKLNDEKGRRGRRHSGKAQFKRVEIAKKERKKDFPHLHRPPRGRARSRHHTSLNREVLPRPKGSPFRTAGSIKRMAEPEVRSGATLAALIGPLPGSCTTASQRCLSSCPTRSGRERS